MSRFHRGYWCDACHRIVADVIVLQLPAGETTRCLTCYPDVGAGLDEQWKIQAEGWERRRWSND